MADDTTLDSSENSGFGPDPDVVEIPPIDAPSDSHLKCYWFIDRSQSERGGPSELFVTFRERTSKKTNAVTPETTYRYTSYDHLSLRQTFEKMAIAGSPGTILHSDLISAGNRGSPV